VYLNLNHSNSLLEEPTYKRKEKKKSISNGEELRMEQWNAAECLCLYFLQ
jgi:hypothetical protein